MKKIYKLLFTSLLLFSFFPGLAQVKASESNLELSGWEHASKRIIGQIPQLTDLVQVSTNQLLITYDQQVDLNAGTKATNYWIQSMTDIRPTGIATLGKNRNVNARNSLTNDKVTIAKVQGDNNSFLLTFNQNIPSKKKYKFIACYVIAPGGAPHNGDNGMIVFTTK